MPCTKLIVNLSGKFRLEFKFEFVNNRGKNQEYNRHGEKKNLKRHYRLRSRRSIRICVKTDNCKNRKGKS